MGGIFGGNKQKSSSSNQAFGQISQALGPSMGFAQQGGNALAALLGGDSSGFDKYKAATGFDFAANEGSRGITGNAAARGLLRSGGTGKSLMDFGTKLQDQYAGNYLDKLLGLGNLGLGAGSVLANAGQTSTSKGKSKSGLGGLLGTAASGIAASDPRLKKNVVKLYELDNGLGVYRYNYINDTGPYVGVMADEVKALMPHALGPVIDGYMTVDYSKIGAI